MLEIEREEAIIIVGVAIFGAAWAFIGVPLLTQTSWFYRLSPLLAYPIYNVGWVALLAVFFGGPLAYLAFEEQRIFQMLKVGMGSWLFFSWIYDLWQPAFYLSTSGQVLIPLGTASLENTAIDSFTSTVAELLVGPAVHTTFLFGFSLWYILAYYVATIVAIILIAFLLPFRKFIKLFFE